MKRVALRRMLKLAAIYVACIALAAGFYLAVAGVPAPPAVKRVGIPRVPWAPIVEAASFVKNGLVGASLIDWDPSGDGILIQAPGLMGSTFARISSPGAKPAKLLSLSPDITYLNTNPSTGKNLLVYAQDGRADRHLFLYNMGTRETRRLTDGQLRHSSPVFDPKGERLAFLAGDTKTDRKSLNVIDLVRPPTLRTICRLDGNWTILAWSPDGERLLVRRLFPGNFPFLYTLDVHTGELHPIGPGQEGKVRNREAVWSRGGRYIYYSGDSGTEFETLRRVEPATGQETELTHDVPWDVTGLDISADDTTLAVLFNRDGAGRLYLLDINGKELRPVPGVPEGSVIYVSFHPKERKLAWTLLRLDSTQSVGSHDLQSGATVDWMGTAAPQRQPVLMHYPTFDQVGGKPRMIDAWLWQAPSSSGKPTPVLINIHGGPEGQSGPISPAVGLLSKRGISELQPNIRGSTGYGKTFRALDDGRLRTNAVKDIGALLDWIATQPNLDRKHVAIFGGSYGGFMTLAAAVEYSDRLACGLDFFGISNFENLIRETKGGQRDWARVEYGDERDPATRDFLQSISPLDHHERIRIPLFIFQGVLDTRVPVGESRRMVDKLRSRGQPVWYVEAADQGHSMPNSVNSLFVVPAGLTFLENCLLGPQGIP